jgi:hypothetical protein
MQQQRGGAGGGNGGVAASGASANTSAGAARASSSAARHQNGNTAQIQHVDEVVVEGVAEAAFNTLTAEAVGDQLLAFSAQLGAAVPATPSCWSAIERDTEAKLRAAFAAAGGQGELQMSKPCLVAGEPKRGVRLISLLTFVSAPAAEQLRGWLERGLGGVLVKAAGRSVLLHLRVPTEAPDTPLAIRHNRGHPMYLFTVSTACNSYPPASLRTFMQQVPQLFHGMRIKWIGQVDRSGQLITARSGNNGAMLPDISSPIPLPPFTVVGLAVEGQKVFKSPVCLKNKVGKREQFFVRRVPNRLRYPAPEPAQGGADGQQPPAAAASQSEPPPPAEEQQQPQPRPAAAMQQPDPAPPAPPAPALPQLPITQLAPQQPQRSPQQQQHPQPLATGGQLPSRPRKVARVQQQQRGLVPLLALSPGASLTQGGTGGTLVALTPRRSSRLASADDAPTPSASGTPKKPRSTPRQGPARDRPRQALRRDVTDDEHEMYASSSDPEVDLETLD